MTATSNSLTLPPQSVAAGAKLFWHRWKATRAAKAVVVIVHGYAEHCRRYDHVAAHLNACGYVVFALDHWGHGQSVGTPGFVPAFSAYTDGVTALLQEVDRAFPDLPKVLLGHSLGGLIAARYLLDHQDKFVAAVLSGPAIKAAEEPSAIMMTIAKIASKLAPKMGVVKLDANGVSRDPQVVANYLADPLVYKGPIGARLAMEMFTAMHAVQANAAKITLPLLVLHGEDDSLTAVEGSRFLNDHVGSVDKKLMLYPGLYHEIFNEPEQAAVLKDMTDWLDSRITQ